MKIKNGGLFGRVVLVVFLMAVGFGVVQAVPEIVETVEVKGRIFSNESDSKNMVIISASQLEEFKIKDMSDLFSFFTAVNVSKRGPLESSYDLTMRGSNFEQVLVLVDGVPFGNPQTGHFNTDFPFSVRDIRRVEILRGGSSMIYGSGAFAGTLNIILKKNSGLRFSATTGENKFFSTHLEAGAALKGVDLRLSVHKSNSSGFHEGREFDQLKVTAGGSFQRNNTDIDVYAGMLKKDFGAQGFYAPFPSIESIDSSFLRFCWKQRTRQFDYTLTYAYSRHDDDFTLDRTRPDYYRNQSLTHRHFANVSGVYRGKRLTASVGAELNWETMDSVSMGNHERNQGAIFFSFNYRLTERDGIDAGIRQNFLPGGRSEFTFYSGFHRRFGGGLVLRAGYGKSFRLPSFTEMYYNSPSNIGDKSIKPESSRNIETSLSLLKGRHHFDLSLFYRDQRNTIDWVKSSSTSPWRAVNLDKNDIVGVELTHHFKSGGTSVIMGIEKLAAVNKQDGLISKYGLRFPDFSLKANVRQKLGKVFDIPLSAAANYTYKQIYNTSERGHFLNLSISVPVGDFELGLRAENVLNTIIQEIPGVDIPGRWIYLTVSYR